MTLLKVCSLEVIPDETIKQFYIKDREVLLINSSRQLYCFEARCTHAGAPLAEGSLESNVLTCPWHGSQFNITDGSVLKGPAEKPLQKYTVTVKEDAVFIEI